MLLVLITYLSTVPLLRVIFDSFVHFSVSEVSALLCAGLVTTLLLWTFIRILKVNRAIILSSDPIPDFTSASRFSILNSLAMSSISRRLKPKNRDQTSGPPILTPTPIHPDDQQIIPTPTHHDHDPEQSETENNDNHSVENIFLFYPNLIGTQTITHPPFTVPTSHPQAMSASSSSLSPSTICPPRLSPRPFSTASPAS